MKNVAKILKFLLKKQIVCGRIVSYFIKGVKIMKRLVTFILLLVMVASLAGCAYLPDDVKSAIDGVLSGIMGDEKQPDDGDDDVTNAH